MVGMALWTMATKVASCNMKFWSSLPFSPFNGYPSCATFSRGELRKFGSMSAFHREKRVLALALTGGSTHDHLDAHVLPTAENFANLRNKLSSMPPWSRISKALARSQVAPRASKSFCYPRMLSKPRWWWRTLACVPYLLPISDILVYAKAAFHLKNLMQDIAFLTYPLIDTLALMPNWALPVMAYMSYLWIVRRKEWPHFLRFHVVMAMLLSSAAQIAGIASHWFPRSLYKGHIQSYIWTTFVFVQLFTVLECIRCALCGTYSDVPFVSDAAYMHTAA